MQKLVTEVARTHGMWELHLVNELRVQDSSFDYEKVYLVYLANKRCLMSHGTEIELIDV